MRHFWDILYVCTVFIVFETYSACAITRDCSNRYTEIRAPVTFPPFVIVRSRYLPNLDEFALIPVVAFPKASIMGFIWSILSSRLRFGALLRYTSCFSNKFALSVFPAPDSPLITIAWFWRWWSSAWYAASATANICGGLSDLAWPLYRFCS